MAETLPHLPPSRELPGRSRTVVEIVDEQIAHGERTLPSTLAIRRHSREPRSSAGVRRAGFLWGAVWGVNKQKASCPIAVVARRRWCRKRSVVACYSKPMAGARTFQ